jgi:glycosyltransferase involved in cell wall biosynthesis
MPRPLRILELRSVRGTGGGPEKTILHGAARAASGVGVTVCYLRDRRDRVFGIDARAAGLPIDYVEVTERHSFDPAIWPPLVRLVRDRRIDIVHAHDYKTNALALALARSTGVRPLSTAHGWTGHSWRERALYYPADRWLLRWFPRVIAVSNEIRDTLIAAGARPERVTTVLNGIDEAVFVRDPHRVAPARRSLGVAPDEVVIGAVGRLEPQKRFDLLLDAFARLRVQRPDTRLIIVGDGSMRDALHARAAALGLGGVCRLLGHCPDIAALHHAFDLFVQSSDYEGTPNAVLEAMALGTPIVATDAGGTRDLVEAGVHAWVIPCGDAAVLAETMIRALDDQEGRAARAHAARRRIERDLSFEQRTRRVEAIYEALADGATGGERYAPASA